MYVYIYIYICKSQKWHQTNQNKEKLSNDEILTKDLIAFTDEILQTPTKENDDDVWGEPYLSFEAVNSRGKKAVLYNEKCKCEYNSCEII